MRWSTDVLPPGDVRDLLVEGVLGGIAGTVVFLPQICLLFFFISLLEETGYLARAAFVVDRLLRRFGLPGQAFVPMLSAHACAIPAIMSTRLIPDRRDRLATIFVTPFLSCAARLPVYVLLIGFLFHERPLLAGLAFVGCYVLGAVAAIVTAGVVRRTILPGASPPMVLELPSYRWPSLRTAVITTLDRAWVFLRKAGTVIVAICIVLWWLGAYPRVQPPTEVASMRAEAEVLRATAPDEADALDHEADTLETSHAKAHSFIGRIGRTLEPAFRPLGYDWQLTVGVVSSLLAREVFVSTMTVVVAGDEDFENEEVLDRLLAAQRTDGTPIFTVGHGIEPLGLLRACDAVPADPRRDPPRVRELDVGCGAASLDDRSCLRSRACDLSDLASGGGGVMPWADWQFWLVTALGLLAILALLKPSLTPNRPVRRCGGCAPVKPARATGLTVEGWAPGQTRSISGG